MPVDLKQWSRGREPAEQVANAPAEAPRQPSAPTSNDIDDSVLEEREPATYKAFNRVSRPMPNLWIRTAQANSRTHISIPFYNQIIHYDGVGRLVTINSGNMTFILRGKNLRNLTRKLNRHEVEWVQEFDPVKPEWELPGVDEALISELNFLPIGLEKFIELLRFLRRPSVITALNDEDRDYLKTALRMEKQQPAMTH